VRGEKALSSDAGAASLAHAEKITLASPELSLQNADKKRAVTVTRSQKSPLGVVLRSFSCLERKK
jgi:hypothetical protein